MNLYSIHILDSETHQIKWCSCLMDKEELEDELPGITPLSGEKISIWSFNLNTYIDNDQTQTNDKRETDI